MFKVQCILVYLQRKQWKKYNFFVKKDGCKEGLHQHVRMTWYFSHIKLKVYFLCEIFKKSTVQNIIHPIKLQWGYNLRWISLEMLGRIIVLMFRSHKHHIVLSTEDLKRCVIRSRVHSCCIKISYSILLKRLFQLVFVVLDQCFDRPPTVCSHVDDSTPCLDDNLKKSKSKSKSKSFSLSKYTLFIL